tara:strand:+ start:2122 stop:2769 length:648 start_codon:yes stop_codon:yes gene_type:complete
MAEVTHQEGTATDQDGETQPGQTADDQPGVDDGATTPTAEQVAEISAAKDRRIGELGAKVQQYQLNEEMRQAREAETTQQNADLQAVEDGQMTAVDASQRASRRVQEAVSNRQDAESLKSLIEETGKMGRFKEAQSLAKEFKLTPEEAETLENDLALTSPTEMRVAADRTAVAKERAALKGTENFDSSTVGTRGSSVDEMSSQEKIRAGTKDFLG